MRFVGPDGETSTSTSTPAKPLADENSFEARGVGRVSRTTVLRAQNLVSAEILSEKLLHPPRGTGTGLDEVSHAAVAEDESVRPVSAGALSAGGMSKWSVGERSFDVFVDEGEWEREEGDILPKELTRSSQRGQWSVPAEGCISEKRLPTASRTKEVAQSDDESGISDSELEVAEDGLQ